MYQRVQKFRLVPFHSFLCLILTLNLYNSKPQNQMCDWSQDNSFFVKQISYIKLFYVTHTFDFEVSLHSWLFWPTVRRPPSPCLVEKYVSRSSVQKKSWLGRRAPCHAQAPVYQACPALRCTVEISKFQVRSADCVIRDFLFHLHNFHWY